MGSIRRVDNPRIERAKRLVGCELSDAPDAAWNKVIEGYDKELPVPFFIRLSVRGTTLTAEFAHGEQSVDSLTEAIDRRVERANTRTARASLFDVRVQHG